MFRTLSERTTGKPVSRCVQKLGPPLTLIFANVLQREGQSCILPLHNAHLSECTFSYHAEELEVVEVNCGEEEHVSDRTVGPGAWSVKSEA